MKTRRKHKSCLNCGELLNHQYNYCPNCGQENTDHDVSLGLLIREFTSNFFSLDSRFAHTFKPFLFNPGKITNAFIEGRRVYYANPIRWYLVISIFHFFFMAKMFEPTTKDKKLRGFMDDPELLTEFKYDSIYNLRDTSDTQGWIFSGEKMSLVRHLNETTNLSPDEVIDSLSMNNQGWFKDFTNHKVVKISQETNASLSSYILRQIPIIVFFILPVYALLLKLFFWRKGLYIKHLIHSIHIHSFLFFLVGWVWVFSLIIEDFEDYGLNVSALIMTIYILFSFKRVYGIKIGWAFLRLFFIGILYSFVLGGSLIVGVLLSLALI